MGTMYDATLLREPDRFDYWNDLIGKFFPRALFRRTDEQPFVAHLERRVLCSVEVSEICCSPLRYDRTRHEQQLDDSDDFLFSLMLEGYAQLEQGGAVTCQRPGDLVLYDAARPFLYDFPQSYRILLAKIPRRALLGRLPRAESLIATSIGCQSPLGELVANMLKSASSLDLPGDSPASAKIASSLIDLLSATVEYELGGRKDSRDRHANLVMRAKQFMQARLYESELDIDSIADALYVSPRTLSRAFAQEGTTVIQWLWRERLAASYAALLEGTATQVLDVALGCGFTSGSHFSRVFKSTYGVLPHTLLRGASRAA